jgi:glycerate-2-kinase
MRIKNAETLINHGNRALRSDVAAILEAGMAAGDPYGNTLELVRLREGKLLVGGRDFEPFDTPKPGVVELDLARTGRIFVFGAGKGIQRVAEALEDTLGDRLAGGHILIKYGDETSLRQIGFTYGGHPIPDENCVNGCNVMVRKIKEANLSPEDVVFTIIGNGASSLLTLPADGLSLWSIMDVTRILQIEKGAPTRDLNAVRNSIDRLKGGRITRLLHPAKMFHILTIDCNTGMSGKPGYAGLTETNIWLHTLPDATTAGEALNVLRRFDAWDEVADDIKTFLQTMPSEQGTLSKEEFERMDCRIYGIAPDHLSVMAASFAMAEKLGYTPHLLYKRGFDLDAAEAGKFVGHMARLIALENRPFIAPCALFMAGEKVVRVGKGGGIGGRNQEFCISVAGTIAGEKSIAVGSVDTDGTDGPGGAFHPEAAKMGVTVLAGGVVDGTTKARAEAFGYDLADILSTHDTSKPLWEMGDGVWAKPSISVQDLTVVLISGKRT